MTPQQRMQSKLETVGLPFKEVKCYGQQIVVTAWSQSAAQRWGELLAKFAHIRGIVETVDETQDPSHYYKANSGLVKGAFTHPVWRVFATIEQGAK